MITQENAKTEILKIRTKYGLTQENLSDLSGVSRPTITNIEKGNIKPQATTLFKLNEYLKRIGEE